ncbi:MAG: tRNA (adenosine(37)-N6)-threonylcarbamoyltransferase complex ATPase subunit type 1 TsaE [Candidatus Colwellbacteria bacterium]|nr:tRNA (adenosine(37)-N6)-threonylcarbamoyltransferase complex ATPase subunit type 1 TsaE [Candidatus Colwellbacteria bacterium]
MKKTILSLSEKDTKKAGSDIALEILEIDHKKAVIISLSGDLGAGKTAFTKGFLTGFGVKSRVTSPTFVVMKRYPVKKGGFKNVYHLDLYRIADSKELDILGFKRILDDPQNIVLIEWPEKGGRLKPNIKVLITHLLEENRRKIDIVRV